MNRREQLEAGLHTIKPGQLQILKDVLAYCRRQNASREDFFAHIPKPLYERLDDAQLAIINNSDESVASRIDDESLDYPEYQLHIAEAVLDSVFKVVRHKSQILALEISDPDNKIVSPIYEGDPEKILARHLSRVVRANYGLVVAPRMVREIVELWMNHADAIDMPAAMANPGDDAWCFHRPIQQPDPSVVLFRWRNILDRMSEPQAFAAWVWGVYSGRYKGRQILWLHGKHGEDGKSAIAQLIARELFGSAHHAIGNASLSSSEKRFLTSFFENARLVIYPDASNKRCLMSEIFKTVASAGADPVLIERKGKQAYTSLLQARMWVCSNYAPEVTNDNFILSRLLYVEISKMENEKPDPKVIDELKTELPGFLHYAKQAYGALCRDDYAISTQTGTQTRVQRMTESFFEEFDVIFTKHWEQCGPDDYVDAAKVRDITRKEGLTSNHDHGRFTTWLEEHKGVQKKKVSADKGKIRYAGMRKRRPPSSDSSSTVNWG